MHGLPKSTPSLQLRHFVQDDALEAMALNAEPSTRHWLPSHVYATAEEAQARLRYLISSYTEPGHPRLGPYVLAVAEASTSRLIGHVGFSPLDDDVEVSYAIAESARGRSYGVESLAHACDWIAGTFSVSRVLAITAVENLPSRRTLERAAFAHERDEDMLFQGVRHTVSRYWWHAPTQVVQRNR
jgi:RimJ/RimL family protein N-acetyltransferase